MIKIFDSWLRWRKPNLNSQDPFLVQKFLFNDMKRLVIFDVGAYVGNITMTYRSIFPDATIYCFEPFPGSFEKLNRLNKDEYVKLYKIALCETNGIAKLKVDSDPSCNSLFPRPKNEAKYYSEKSRNIGQIKVKTLTLDTFCNRENISKIDILKMDVEGAELKVLKGACERLINNHVKLIFTEVMFVPHYDGGCMFHELASFLHSYGYTLLNLYNLKQAKNGQLRWGNAIFLSPAIRAKIKSPKTV